MKRGPRSTASLVVAAVTEIADARPSPPDWLAADLHDLWRETVRRLPGNWFPVETHRLLGLYCEHVHTAQSLGDLIAEFRSNPEWLRQEDGLARLKDLTTMRDREAKGAAAMARALRIAKSAQTRPETAFRMSRDAMDGPKPWTPREET